MINIALCDDNVTSITSIAKLIEAALINLDFEAEISLITSNQDLVLSKIKRKEIDILFLDVDFKNHGKNGIAFAKDLREINKDFYLIFLTAHFEYSMLAFKCKTFDYLMKPIVEFNLIDVLKRLKEDFFCSNSALVKLNKDFWIKPNNILFIERNKSKTTVYTKDSTYETNYSLNSILEELPDSFVRIHRSYIVNQEHVQKINKDKKLIIFDGDACCPLGQFDYKL